VLVVGVGGIGCEILKCLSKLPVKQVDIADLDTIEVANEGLYRRRI
jgi:molybdopterin/thiamine biosynthesis adenylyltransferase